MALNKFGSPAKIKVVKNSGFSMDVNALAEMLQKQWPDKHIEIDNLHEALKSIGVSNYSAENLENLMGRLQAVGFTITK